MAGLIVEKERIAAMLASKAVGSAREVAAGANTGLRFAGMEVGSVALENAAACRGENAALVKVAAKVGANPEARPGG